MTDPPPDPPTWPQSLLPPPPPPARAAIGLGCVTRRCGSSRPRWSRSSSQSLALGVIEQRRRLGAKAGDVVTDLKDLEAGDCIDDSTFDEPDAVMSGLITIAVCDGPHDLEVSRVHTLEAGEGATYPGESALIEQSIEMCERAFEPYVGSDYYESSLDYSFYYPTEQTWGKYDDRTIVCVVFDPSLEPSMPRWRGQSGRTSSGAPLVSPGPHRRRGDAVEGGVDGEDDQAVTCRRSRHALAGRDRDGREPGQRGVALGLGAVVEGEVVELVPLVGADHAHVVARRRGRR